MNRSLSGHQVNTCSVQYHPYGDFIVSGSIDGSMKVWDVRNRSCIQTYTGHSKEVINFPFHLLLIAPVEVISNLNV